MIASTNIGEVKTGKPYPGGLQTLATWAAAGVTLRPSVRFYRFPQSENIAARRTRPLGCLCKLKAHKQVLKPCLSLSVLLNSR